MGQSTIEKWPTFQLIATRKRFNQQLDIGVVPIPEVQINLKSRHQLPPDLVILPKPGKKSQAQIAEESVDNFVKKRKGHSAVESNINELEHHGLSKCRDKGIDGFKRYVAYEFLAYNLHRMGRIVVQIAKKESCRLFLIFKVVFCQTLDILPFFEKLNFLGI